MIIDTSKSFDKHYKKRIKTNQKLYLRAKKRIALFGKNQQHFTLKDHGLTGGKKDLRAFSVTGDIRVIYKKIDNNHVILLDIGTHNQVY